MCINNSFVSYDTSTYTDEQISTYDSNVRWYNETGWGWYDESYIFTFGYQQEISAAMALFTYYVYLSITGSSNGRKHASEA